MKKYILSALIVGTFGFYALYQHSNLSNNSVAISDTQVTSSSSSLPPMNNFSVATSTSPVTKPTSSTTSSSSTSKATSTKSSSSSTSSKSSSTSTKKSTTTSTKTTTSTSNGKYKDGTYTGPSVNAYYGNVQVQAVIRNGQLADVVFLSYPNDRGHSVMVNRYAMPRLKSEAISAQSANVNTISGASYSSAAFRKSLGSALSRATA